MDALRCRRSDGTRLGVRSIDRVCAREGEHHALPRSSEAPRARKADLWSLKSDSRIDHLCFLAARPAIRPCRPPPTPSTPSATAPRRVPFRPPTPTATRDDHSRPSRPSPRPPHPLLHRRRAPGLPPPPWLFSLGLYVPGLRGLPARQDPVPRQAGHVGQADVVQQVPGERQGARGGGPGGAGGGRGDDGAFDAGGGVAVRVGSGFARGRRRHARQPPPGPPPRGPRLVRRRGRLPPLRPRPRRGALPRRDHRHGRRFGPQIPAAAEEPARRAHARLRELRRAIVVRSHGADMLKEREGGVRRGPVPDGCAASGDQQAGAREPPEAGNGRGTPPVRRGQGARQGRQGGPRKEPPGQRDPAHARGDAAAARAVPRGAAVRESAGYRPRAGAVPRRGRGPHRAPRGRALHRRDVAGQHGHDAAAGSQRALQDIRRAPDAPGVRARMGRGHPLFAGQDELPRHVGRRVPPRDRDRLPPRARRARHLRFPDAALLLRARGGGRGQPAVGGAAQQQQLPHLLLRAARAARGRERGAGAAEDPAADVRRDGAVPGFEAEVGGGEGGGGGDRGGRHVEVVSNGPCTWSRMWHGSRMHMFADRRCVVFAPDSLAGRGSWEDRVVQCIGQNVHRVASFHACFSSGSSSALPSEPSGSSAAASSSPSGTPAAPSPPASEPSSSLSGILPSSKSVMRSPDRPMSVHSFVSLRDRTSCRFSARPLRGPAGWNRPPR